ncbi:hypothetical protein CK203_114602 [Vitis vinifera]|uniref:Uncharacterized protein n=1 Tax=Vitis vinifera TaxID=29760 RepID=A0A438C974_VITVI|nr:hypothetical protein CK203_114602 [Vitis vinifera]
MGTQPRFFALQQLPPTASPMEEMGAESQNLPPCRPSPLDLVLVKGPARRRSRLARDLKSGLLGREPTRPGGGPGWGFTRIDSVGRDCWGPRPGGGVTLQCFIRGNPVDDATCISASVFSYAELEEKLKRIPPGSDVVMLSTKMFEVVETLVSGLRGMVQQHDLFSDLLRTADYMKAFASQRRDSEDKLRLRLEEAKASLSTAREDNEALRAELAEAKSQEETLDARLLEVEDEKALLRGREELEADYQKQVDDMYFFGYRCCMKKHGIKRNSAIRMDASFLTSFAQSKFLPNSAFASSCFPASVRIVGNPISVGMIASIPYARAKSVFPVGRPGVFRTEISEGDAIKLWTIVGYNGLGDSEATNDVFPKEFGDDIFVFDASICFSFHPFTKVIRGNKLPHPSSWWANNILANGPYTLETVLQNDCHIPPRAFQLTHTGPLNDLGTEGRDL